MSTCAFIDITMRKNGPQDIQQTCFKSFVKKEWGKGKEEVYRPVCKKCGRRKEVGLAYLLLN